MRSPTGDRRSRRAAPGIWLYLHATMTTPPQLKRPRVLCILVILMLTASACFSGGTRRSPSMKSAKNVKATQTELSSRNQSLLGVYSAEIEAAADKIIKESPSAAARHLALVWKAEAIPALQVSLLNPDPIGAILDTWVFIFQMRAY